MYEISVWPSFSGIVEVHRTMDMAFAWRVARGWGDMGFNVRLTLPDGLEVYRAYARGAGVVEQTVLAL